MTLLVLRVSDLGGRMCVSYFCPSVSLYSSGGHVRLVPSKLFTAFLVGLGAYLCLRYPA
jgi:hypothetical protein